MKKSCTIKLKAIFLFAVFSMNMCVGFACSLGLDMGFNAPHHHKEEATFEHHHTNGDKDHCCNDSVIQFQKFDKNTCVKIFVSTPEWVAVLPIYYGSVQLKLQTVAPQKYLIRYFYPPPWDIRIAIQRFQI